MTSSQLRGNIPESISKIDFSGFHIGKVVHHESKGYMIGVQIPRLMPFNLEGEEPQEDYEVIPLEKTIIENDNLKINAPTKINTVNYFLVSPFYWTRKCYKNRAVGKMKPKGSCVTHGPQKRSRVPAFVLTHMEDPETPSQQIEPHQRYDRIIQDMGAGIGGSILIDGGIRITDNVVQHDHAPPGDPSATGGMHARYDASTGQITSDRLWGNRVRMSIGLSRDELKQTTSESDLTHKWEESIEEIYKQAIPQIGETVMVIFLDEDPQKGYYFPFTIFSD